MTITTLGVIGTGAMGSGIIEVAAKAGVTVIARDINAAAVEAGQGKVEGSMAKAVERGKLDEAARDAAVANITWTTDLADLAPCDLVIEAAPENLSSRRRSSPSSTTSSAWRDHRHEYVVVPDHRGRDGDESARRSSGCTSSTRRRS